MGYVMRKMNTLSLMIENYQEKSTLKLLFV